MLSAQISHKSSDGLNGDDKDPRDVSNNGFNRFDPKYISIGPKAVRGSNNLNVVAATSNKCATLRHVGRYGGSLKTSSGGLATSPNLRSAKIPSIATVSKDYCQQQQQQQTTEFVGHQQQQLSSAQQVSVYTSTMEMQQQQPINAGMVPQVQIQSQQIQLTVTAPVPPAPAPLPPPKPKISNTFTEIPGTTGVGSCYAKEQQQLLLQQQLLQKHQQQTPPPAPPPQQQQMAQVPPQHHPPTTHILPASAVYSIETSGFAQQQREPPRPQQRSLNPASIVNQPLPEIPQAAQQQQHHQQQQSKISPQPLCAANLNQYRSLQRPQGSSKLQLPPVASSIQQQQQFISQQMPPSLPPKNRHKSSRDVTGGGNISHMQTLPPKSASLRQHQSLSHEREREREARHEARSRRAETLDNVRSNALAYLEQYCVAAPPPPPLSKKQHSYDQQQMQRSAQQMSQHLNKECITPSAGVQVSTTFLLQSLVSFSVSLSHLQIFIDL